MQKQNNIQTNTETFKLGTDKKVNKHEDMIDWGDVAQKDQTDDDWELTKLYITNAMQMKGRCVCVGGIIKPITQVYKCLEYKSLKNKDKSLTHKTKRLWVKDPGPWYMLLYNLSAVNTSHVMEK